MLDVNKENVALVISGGGIIDFLRTFLEVPEESEITDASLCDVTSAKPEFLPDVDGDYVVELTVSMVKNHYQASLLINEDIAERYKPCANFVPDVMAFTAQGLLCGMVVMSPRTWSDIAVLTTDVPPNAHTGDDFTIYAVTRKAWHSESLTL